MIFGRKDTTIQEIERRLRHIVDAYKEKGMTTQDIRIHFLNPRNFRKIIRVLGDIHQVYDEGNYILDFETMVYDKLFFGIALMTKVECECEDINCECDEDEF